MTSIRNGASLLVLCSKAMVESKMAQPVMVVPQQGCRESLCLNLGPLDH